MIVRLYLERACIQKVQLGTSNQIINACYLSLDEWHSTEAIQVR